jgi:putative transposase
VRKSLFTEEQVLGVLKAVDAGMKVAESGCKRGISDAALRNWRCHYGVDASKARRLHQLEEENLRLIRRVG